MAKRRIQHGLTVVELLVCIAILAILVAVLLPRGPRGVRSVGVMCLSNQHQIANAGLLYQGDNNGDFPNLDTSPGNDGPITLGLLTNYSANRTDRFMCPVVVQRRGQERAWNQGKFVPALDSAFFASNGNDYAYYDGALTNSYTNALIADRLAWTNRSDVNLWNWSHNRGRINAAFVDGHAEILRADRIVGRENNPAWSAAQDPKLRR